MAEENQQTLEMLVKLEDGRYFSSQDASKDTSQFDLLSRLEKFQETMERKKVHFAELFQRINHTLVTAESSAAPRKSDSPADEPSSWGAKTPAPSPASRQHAAADGFSPRRNQANVVSAQRLTRERIRAARADPLIKEALLQRAEQYERERRDQQQGKRTGTAVPTATTARGGGNSPGKPAVYFPDLNKNVGNLTARRAEWIEREWDRVVAARRRVLLSQYERNAAASIRRPVGAPASPHAATITPYRASSSAEGPPPVATTVPAPTSPSTAGDIAALCLLATTVPGTPRSPQGGSSIGHRAGIRLPIERLLPFHTARDTPPARTITPGRYRRLDHSISEHHLLVSPTGCSDDEAMATPQVSDAAGVGSAVGTSPVQARSKSCAPAPGRSRAAAAGEPLSPPRVPDLGPSLPTPRVPPLALETPAPPTSSRSELPHSTTPVGRGRSSARSHQASAPPPPTSPGQQRAPGSQRALAHGREGGTSTARRPTATGVRAK